GKGGAGVGGTGGAAGGAGFGRTGDSGTTGCSGGGGAVVSVVCCAAGTGSATHGPLPAVTCTGMRAACVPEMMSTVTSPAWKVHRVGDWSSCLKPGYWADPKSAISGR